MSDTLSQIPIAAYPLAVGLFANSGVFFGTLGLTLAGPVPIIKGELGASTLSVQQKVAIWRMFFDSAAVGFGLPLRYQTGCKGWLDTDTTITGARGWRNDHQRSAAPRQYPLATD